MAQQYLLDQILLVLNLYAAFQQIEGEENQVKNVIKNKFLFNKLNKNLFLKYCQISTERFCFFKL